MKTHPAHHAARDASYLRWYKAIVLADGGEGEGAQRLAWEALREDAQLLGLPDSEDIGRRQYTSLRRFLEHHSGAFRNPTEIGHLSQLLQRGHRHWAAAPISRTRT